MSNDVEREEGRPWGERPLDERRRFALEGASTLFTSAGGSGGPFGEHGVPLQMLAFIQNALSNLRHYIEADDLPDVSWASPVVELEYEAPWASFRKPEEGPLPWAEGDLEPSGDDLETADSAIAWSTDMFLKVGERLLLHALTHKVFYEEKRGRLVPYLPKELADKPWADVAPLFRPWMFGGEPGDAWWADFLAEHGVIHTAGEEAGDADLPAFMLSLSWTPDEGEEGEPFTCTVHPVVALYPAIIDRKAKHAYHPVLVGLVAEGKPLAEWPPETRERLWDELFAAFDRLAEGQELATGADEAAALAEATAEAAPVETPPGATPVRRGRTDLPVWTSPPILAYQQAAADARTGRHFTPAPGGGLVHTRGKAGYLVSYHDPEASVAELMQTLSERGGQDAVFVVAAAVQHALEHEGEGVHLDDLLLDIGWDRTHGGRGDARRGLARTLLMLNAWTVTGTGWGEFRDKDGRSIDVSSCGPLFTSTILYPRQQTLLDNPEPLGATFTLGDFLRRVKDHPQVMASFGSYARLARIPRGKVSGAWAASIGLALLTRWRELAGKPGTKVATAGEANRLTVQTQHFTRRYLIETYPPEPTAADVLAGPQPGRARRYWRDAIALLRREGIIGPAPADYRELGKPLPRYRWADAWLDEPLDIRPAPAYQGDFHALAQRAVHERKKRQRRKLPPGV